MKKYGAVLIGLIWFTLLNGQAAGSSTNASLSDQHIQLISKRTSDFPNHTTLALAEIENGTVRFFGIKKEQDTILFVNNKQSIFEIGSISKVFTAALLSSFVIEEKLHLDDNIEAPLGFKISSKETIALKQLANHTSGLPRLPSNLNLLAVDISNPYQDYDEQSLEQYLKDTIILDNPPGHEYAYSNLGAGLLAHILSEYSNSTYEQLLQQRLFKKYNMHHSTTDRSTVIHELIPPRNASGEMASYWDFDALAGAGAILSSVEDLSNFALANMNQENQELALMQESTHTVNKNMKVGLGWHRLIGKKGNEIIWHNGGTGGFSSSMAINTAQNKAVIILSNVSAFHPKMGNIDQLCFDLMKVLEEKSD